MKILKIIGIIIGIIVIAFAAVVGYVNYGLPNIDTPEINVEKTDAQVKRGDYLANHVYACMDCHSTRDWNKFSGPLVDGTLGSGGEKFPEEMGFPGDIYAPNITPYNLKDWSDGEIFRSITSGVKKNGDPIFPVMPYHSYGKTDKEDIKAIIAYLRSLEPVKKDNPETEFDFPMSIITHLMPQEPQFMNRPPKADTKKYGKYIATAAGCRDCHTPFDKGQPKEDMFYAGGREFPMSYGTLRAPNITPDKKTGIGTWTQEQFVARFKNYSPDHYDPPKVSGKDFQTIMPWTVYADMDSTDMKALYTYLHSLEPIQNKVKRISYSDKAKK